MQRRSLPSQLTRYIVWRNRYIVGIIARVIFGGAVVIILGVIVVVVYRINQSYDGKLSNEIV
jgi:hypothetical protein